MHILRFVFFSWTTQLPYQQRIKNLVLLNFLCNARYIDSVPPFYYFIHEYNEWSWWYSAALCDITVTLFSSDKIYIFNYIICIYFYHAFYQIWHLFCVCVYVCVCVVFFVTRNKKIPHSIKGYDMYKNLLGQKLNTPLTHEGFGLSFY